MSPEWRSLYTKLKTKTFVLNVGAIILLLGSCYYFKNPIYVYVISFVYIAVTCFKLFHDLRQFPKKKRKNKFWIMFFVPTGALILVIVILILYPDATIIRTTDVLSFAGNFLAFSGAFCLGYFIYQKEQDQIFESKLKKIKLLRADIDAATDNLLILQRYVERSKDGPDPQKASFLIIHYDPKWREYYLEYEALTKTDSDLRDCLEEYYRLLEDVNICLYNGDIQGAYEFYRDYLERDKYSIRKYNDLEAKMCLLAACDKYINKDPISLLDQDKTKKVIQKIQDDYSGIVENIVFNEVIRSTEKRASASLVNRKTTDYMLTHSEAIKELIGAHDQERIMMTAVFQSSLRLKEYGRVELVWGEYVLQK